MTPSFPYNSMPKRWIRLCSLSMLFFSMNLDSTIRFAHGFSNPSRQAFTPSHQQYLSTTGSFGKLPNTHNFRQPQKDFNSNPLTGGVSVSKRSSSTRLYNAAGAAIPPISWLWLGLLAMQFGCQPLLTKAFTPKKIVKSTVILAQDVVKFVAAFFIIYFSGNFDALMKQWTFKGALLGAGIPSALYVVQNYCALMAYQNLPPVTFNILNQTKTLSAALFCYLIMGRRQSPLQIVSLLMLLLSALIIEKIIPINGFKKEALAPAAELNEAETVKEEEAKKEEAKKKMEQLKLGVLPVLVASGISGLAGSLVQRNLQIMKCDTYVYSMELSFFSGIFMMLTLLLGSPDGKQIREDKQLLKGWTWKTWIPVISHAAGGVVVGLVTLYAGAVRKGFALIFGLILSGILQNVFLSNDGISSEQVVGGILASISLFMHSRFPPI